jgi:predicted nucleic acid-binding protein
MCLIVDTNVLGEVFGKPGSVYACAREWLVGRDGVLVIGGTHYWAEFKKVRAALQFALEMERAGKLRRRSNSDVDVERTRVTLLPLRSDDPHIIALARESGARVLCSEDADLIADFVNPKLVPNPRGKICTAISRNAVRRMPTRTVLRHSPGCPKWLLP